MIAEGGGEESAAETPNRERGRLERTYMGVNLSEVGVDRREVIRVITGRDEVACEDGTAGEWSGEDKSATRRKKNEESTRPSSPAWEARDRRSEPNQPVRPQFEIGVVELVS